MRCAGLGVWAAAVLVLGAAACLERARVTCADGRICPAGTVCDDTHGLCVDPAQIAECRGDDDDTPCEFGGVAGFCQDGVCLRAGCGDGIRAGSEACDRDDHGEITGCQSLGFHQPGPVSCKRDCTFDTSACSERCGDLVRNGDEDCDNEDLGQASCASLGFYEAPGLACTSFCTFDTSGCTGECGDGIVNGDESCDLSLPATGSCVDFGWDAGTLGCSPFCTPGFDDCVFLDWRAEPTTTSDPLSAIWGSAEDDLWVGGKRNVMLHYDGTTWTEVALPAGVQSVVAIHGTAADDIWAVGPADGYLHYDGTSWSKIADPDTLGLRSIFAIARDDVWAVGGPGDVRHYDGTGWTTVASPTQAGFTEVWASGSDDIYIAGAGVAYRFDGQSGWTNLGLPDGFVYTVWGLSSDFVLVAANNRAIHTYDGTGWTVQGVDETLGAIRAIRGVSRSDLFALTSRPDVVLHFDGAHWTPMDVPLSSLTDGIWSAGAGHAYIVGDGGVTVRNRGTGWRRVDDLPGGVSAYWAASPDEIVAVGYNGAGEAAAFRYRFGTWTEMTVQAQDPIWDVWGAAADDIYAVSGRTILRYTTSWQTVDTVSEYQLGVWGAGANDVFTVGANGSVYHSTGAGFSPLASGVTEDLYELWGSSGSSLFAVGDGGTILRYDGSSWSPMSSGTSADLRDIWGSGPDDVFAVGKLGTIVHFDGTAWSPMATDTTHVLYAVAGTGPTDVFAVGQLGTMLHYDGIRWSPVRTGASDPLNGLVAFPEKIVFGAFPIQLLRTVPWVCAATETACSDHVDNDCDGAIDAGDGDC